MKNLLFGLIAMVLFSNVTFGQSRSNINSCVTESEYKTLDQDEKKMVDLINGAISGLKGIALENGNAKLYTATVAVSQKSSSLTGIIIGSNENSTFFHRVGSCQICGLSSAYACIKRIKAFMASQNLTEIDLHLSMGSDGCGTISW